MAGFPYRVVQINWNPLGHFPPQLFGINHMDYHFHTQTLAELDAITVGICRVEHVSCDLRETLERELLSQHLPEGYGNTNLDAAVAQVGTHLVGPGLPENTDQFDQIFIHGAYDGRLSFQEPMITPRYFQQLKTDTTAGSITNRCHSIAQPQEYPDDKAHPKQWCSQYFSDTDTYRVSLTEFSTQLNNPQGLASSGVAKTTIYVIIIAAMAVLATLGL